MEPRPNECPVCGLDPVVQMLTRPKRIIAESPAMQDVLQRVGRFARSGAPVVILGESGTGKELVARSVHAASHRAAGPFLAVNVGALPSELLESELFGHVRGAFTGAHQAHRGLFEAASGGTLFLDEIGELPHALQVKLLRVLQDGEVRRIGDTRAFVVDVRIVCATHRDLPSLVERGLFREDLFYRLKVLTLRLPPLRERPQDVLPLAHQMLADEAGHAASFSPAAEAALRAHRWPGNVRELENAVRHGAALAGHEVVGPEHLPEEIVRPRVERAAAGPTPAAAPGPQLITLAEVERSHVLGVLGAVGGSIVEAARVLGIGRNTLWRKLKQWT
ncbi:MAG: sigma-54 dependent transcriptional regulator [Myxococcota bacterium]